MSPPQLDIDILLSVGCQLLTADEGDRGFANFNSFLKANHELYACGSRTLWRKAAQSTTMTNRAFTHLIRTNNIPRLSFLLEMGADIETKLLEVVDKDSRITKNTPLKAIAKGIIVESVDMTNVKDRFNHAQFGVTGSGPQTRASQPLLPSTSMLTFLSMFCFLLCFVRCNMHDWIPLMAQCRCPTGARQQADVGTRFSGSAQWPRRKPSFRARQHVCSS
jgi:hypothetical protein